MAKRILILFGICMLGGVLIGPGDLSSCGPFLPQTVFTSKLAPFDEPRFFSGQLDILQPRYRRIYLMAAYRYLSGIGLSPADQQALAAKPDAQAVTQWSEPESPAIQAWLAARVQVGAARLDRIDRFKMLPDRVFIVNCGDDAFRHAAATLIERGRSGAAHDDLRDWVAAQDQVFANCSDPPAPSIPEALPATAAHWMQADRAYQIAAAEFYAGQFDAASADFLRITGDRSSPWHGIAPYLAARALIRKTTTVDAATAPAAQRQLRRVLDDPDAAAWHASARALARYLRIRTDPEGAFSELAHAAATQKDDVAGIMNDFRLMLDQYSNRGNQPPRDQDIADWIAAMQANPGDHALTKWRATRSLPWLVAALTYADQPDPELMAAAAQVSQNSPAFLTVGFHRLRLLPANAARPGLDAMLRRKMPVSARNLFLAERLRVSRDWEEFLRYAPRTAAGTFVEGQGELPATARAAYFDDDAARILDRQAPLAVLGEAARRPDLPSNLRLEIARAVWVRAILLNDAGTAGGIAPLLASLAPDLKPYLDHYLSAPDENARQFAAAWLLLNNPGMRPSVDSGAGRIASTPLIDSFRDNWWCPGHGTPLDIYGSRYNGGSPVAVGADAPLNAPLGLLYQGSFPDAGFVSAAQRGDASREGQRLARLPAAPTLLARQAVEWAQAHPDDSRAADALHLAVRAGHYACGGDAETNRSVKRAFELLHSRYGKTEAARRTPYWYSDGGR